MAYNPCEGWTPTRTWTKYTEDSAIVNTDIICTFECTLIFPTDPQGVIFHAGGTWKGIGLSCYSGNLIWRVGDGTVADTEESGDATLFVRVPLVDIPKDVPVQIVLTIDNGTPSVCQIWIDGEKKGETITQTSITSYTGGAGTGYCESTPILNGMMGIGEEIQFNGTCNSDLYLYENQLPSEPTSVDTSISSSVLNTNSNMLNPFMLVKPSVTVQEYDGYIRVRW